MKQKFIPFTVLAALPLFSSNSAHAQTNSQLECLINMHKASAKYVTHFNEREARELILPGNKSLGSVLPNDDLVALPAVRGKQKGIQVYSSGMSYFAPLPDSFEKHEGNRAYEFSFNLPHSQRSYCAKVTRTTYLSMQGVQTTAADWIVDAMEAAKSSLVGYEADVSSGSCGKSVGLEEYQTPETYNLLRGGLLSELRDLSFTLKIFSSDYSPRSSISLPESSGWKDVPLAAAYQELVGTVQTCANNEKAPWLKKLLIKEVDKFIETGRKAGMFFSTGASGTESKKTTLKAD